MSNRSNFTAIATAVVVAACQSSTGMANDAVGKKICWTLGAGDSGVLTNYSGGKFSDTHWGNGTCQGRHCVSNYMTLDRQFEKLPDGTFKLTVVLYGKTFEGTAHYCQ
jgi:hypothetical protein